MVQKTLLPSDMVAVVAAIDPDATPPSTVETDWIDMSNWAAIMAVVSVGTLGAAATVDAKLEQATDAAGAGAKDLDGAALAQITQAGADQSDSQAVLQVYAEDLDLQGAFTYLRLSITVGGAASDIGALVLGCSPRFGPASAYDADTVGEIKSPA